MADAAIHIYRSDLGSNWPLLAVFFLPWLLALAVTMRHPDFWPGFLLMGLLFLALLYYLLSFRLSFSEAGLEYKSPFGRARRAGYGEISRIYYHIASQAEAARSSSVFQLVIESGGGEGRICINTKPFSRAALRHIARELVERCRHAAVDDKIRGWAKGDCAGLAMSWRQRGEWLFWLFAALTAAAVVRAVLKG